MSRMLSRWWAPGVVTLAAVSLLLAVPGATGVLVAASVLGYAALVSPVVFPRSADLGEALERATAGQAPLVIWKPGCVYCVRLRLGLVATGRQVSWVDSSLDPEAEAVVRSANGGDHTTPTVLFGAETRTNPAVGWVRGTLA